MSQRVASLYADVDVRTGRANDGLRETRNQLQQTAKSAGNTNMRFTEMASKFGTLQSAAGLTVAAFQQVWGIFEQGAALELAKNRFDNLTASIGTTSDSMLNDLSRATGGMMTNAEQIESASQIISLGLADNQKDVVDLASLVSQLGWDMQQVILTFANNSKARLDALGLSVTDVEERMKKFEAQGYDTDKAFDLAVIEAGQAKLELLGSAANTGAGGMERLAVKAKDTRDAILGIIATRTEGVWAGLANVLDARGQALADLEAAHKQGLITDFEYAKGLLDLNTIYSDGHAVLEKSREELDKLNAGTEQADSKLSSYIVTTDAATAANVDYSDTLAMIGEAMVRPSEFEEYKRGVEQSAAATKEARDAAMELRNEQVRLREEQNKLAEAMQAEFAQTFTAALDEQNIAYGRWVTTATAVGGLSEDQQANFDELSNKAERLRDNIRSLQGGVAGLGLEESELNDKLAENYDQLSLVEAAMAPLNDSTTTYTDIQRQWIVDAEAMNSTLFDQITANTDNEIAIAAAGIALGLYDEEQVEAALNAAIMNEKINALAQAFVNGDITAGQMRQQMEDIVAGSPYTSEVDVLVDEALNSVNKIRTELDKIPRSITTKHTVESSGVPANATASSGGGGGGRQGAVGGDVRAGETLMVGELGPELFTAPSNGQLIPNNKLGGMGGGIYNIAVHVSGGNGSPRNYGKQIATSLIDELGKLT